MEQTNSFTEKCSFSSMAIPTTAIATKRYDNKNIVVPTYGHFSPSFFEPHGEPGPRYLPHNWSSFTHPEGQPYFFRNASLKIVTEAFLYREEIANKVSRWAKWFENEVSSRGISLPETVELFLHVDENSEGCEYYFVDHATRSEFWLTKIPAELLGLPAAVSSSHIRLVLEEHYWNHVQYFPMHFGGLTQKTLDELIGIFVHGQADQLTSDVSTFPYSAEKCSQFLTLLRGSRGDGSNGHITCVAARLFGYVTASRFTSLYGQENARLSRDQPVFHAPASRHHWLSTVASRLMLGAPATFSAQFKDLYVDKLVYIDQWQTFTAQCVQAWQSQKILAISMLFSPLLMSILPHKSDIISYCTVFTSLLGIISAEVLTRKLSNLTVVDASDAANYLSSIYSETYGFQFASIVFALPQAASHWSLLLLSAQILFTFYAIMGPIYAAFLFVLLVGAQFFTIYLAKAHSSFTPPTLSSEKVPADERV